MSAIATSPDQGIRIPEQTRPIQNTETPKKESKAIAFLKEKATRAREFLHQKKAKEGLEAIAVENKPPINLDFLKNTQNTANSDLGTTLGATLLTGKYENNQTMEDAISVLQSRRETPAADALAQRFVQENPNTESPIIPIKAARGDHVAGGNDTWVKGSTYTEDPLMDPLSPSALAAVKEYTRLERAKQPHAVAKGFQIGDNDKTMDGNDIPKDPFADDTPLPSPIKKPLDTSVTPDVAPGEPTPLIRHNGDSDMIRDAVEPPPFVYTPPVETSPVAPLEPEPLPRDPRQEMLDEQQKRIHDLSGPPRTPTEQWRKYGGLTSFPGQNPTNALNEMRYAEQSYADTETARLAEATRARTWKERRAQAAQRIHERAKAIKDAPKNAAQAIIDHNNRQNASDHAKKDGVIKEREEIRREQMIREGRRFKAEAALGMESPDFPGGRRSDAPPPPPAFRPDLPPPLTIGGEVIPPPPPRFHQEAPTPPPLATAESIAAAMPLPEVVPSALPLDVGNPEETPRQAPAVEPSAPQPATRTESPPTPPEPLRPDAQPPEATQPTATPTDREVYRLELRRNTFLTDEEISEELQKKYGATPEPSENSPSYESMTPSPDAPIETPASAPLPEEPETVEPNAEAEVQLSPMDRILQAAEAYTMTEEFQNLPEMDRQQYMDDIERYKNPSEPEFTEEKKKSLLYLLAILPAAVIAATLAGAHVAKAASSQ